MAKLTTNFNIPKDDFVSTNLKIGEMMQLGANELCANHIIIETYDRYVSLNNPRKTWNLGSKLYGRKLLPGESVTLTQV